MSRYRSGYSGVSRVGLRGVSKSHKCNRLVKVGASKGVIRVDLKNTWPGGGSGQPENPPGYATGLLKLDSR